MLSANKEYRVEGENEFDIFADTLSKISESLDNNCSTIKAKIINLKEDETKKKNEVSRLKKHLDLLISMTSKGVTELMDKK